MYIKTFLWLFKYIFPVCVYDSFMGFKYRAWHYVKSSYKVQEFAWFFMMYRWTAKQQMFLCTPYIGLSSCAPFSLFWCTLQTDQPFNFEFPFESVLNLELPKIGIGLGIPILMGINLGECDTMQWRYTWRSVNITPENKLFCHVYTKYEAYLPCIASSKQVGRGVIRAGNVRSFHGRFMNTPNTYLHQTNWVGCKIFLQVNCLSVSFGIVSTLLISNPYSWFIQI